MRAGRVRGGFEIEREIEREVEVEIEIEIEPPPTNECRGGARGVFGSERASERTCVWGLARPARVEQSIVCWRRLGLYHIRAPCRGVVEGSGGRDVTAAEMALLSK